MVKLGEDLAGRNGRPLEQDLFSECRTGRQQTRQGYTEGQRLPLHLEECCNACCSSTAAQRVAAC